MKKILFLFLVAVSFTGCIQNIQNIQDISANSLTIRIPATKLNSRLQDLFPIISNLQYGSIELSNPNAILKKGSDRMTAGTTISYSNDNLPTQKGLLYISGSPYLNGETGEIFLQRPKIEKLQFNGVDLFDYVKQPIIDALTPTIDNLFATHPIYKLDMSKAQNSFIKKLYIEDGSLLVTFGL